MSALNPVAPLGRRLLAEGVGTALLVTVVVGSGIAAQRLSPGDAGLRLLENSIATALGLAVLILMFGPVSGAHFNPAISLVDWALGRRADGGPTIGDTFAYVLVQSVGAVLGAVLANCMYGLSAVQVSGNGRAGGSTVLAEIVATAGLITLVLSLARSGRAPLSAAAVGAYICSAYWFTSSTSFANPAVTVGRMFSDTFAGIAPASVPAFVLAQLVGAALGAAVVLTLYPDAPDAAGAVVVPHPFSTKG
jgi:glycerol uptake facilitator-like aquaporin